ncbi:MAG TPA: type II toxin-antitoxin system RelE/ParE family toxin [Ignavibacteria bacterium]|nr:type II toxin-antitoxin system RelE/ParE family toxin [Ignavibacteria bacterium]
MAGKIIWSPRAAENLEDIHHYIAKDSNYYASLVVKRILELVKTIPEQPQSGRIVPEYNNDSIREKFYSHYRIIYRIKDEVIEIVAIYHGARLLK